MCIGLTIAAGLAVLHDWDCLGSVLFSLALNFKQMTLYYAPVFFVALLRKCARRHSAAARAAHFCRVGAAVLITFAVLWVPFCLSTPTHSTPPPGGYSCPDTLLAILGRCFPFSRGIFEDKVGNLWFGLSVLYDYRPLVTAAHMKLAATLLTCVLISPVCWDLARRPLTAPRLVLALVNCSLGFFLASFQVCVCGCVCA